MFGLFENKTKSWKVGFAISVFCAFLSIVPILALIARFFGDVAFIVGFLVLGTLVSCSKTVITILLNKEQEKEKKILTAIIYVCANLAILPVLCIIFRFFGEKVAFFAAITIAIGMLLVKSLFFGSFMRRFQQQKEKEK